MDEQHGNLLNMQSAPGPQSGWPPRLVRLIPLVVGLLSGSSVEGKLLFYEGFDYPVGEELGETVSNPPWENDKRQFTIVPGSLHHPGLKESVGHRVHAESTQPSLDSVRTGTGAWPEQTNGCVYLSFLLRILSTDGIPSGGAGTSLVTVGDTPRDTQLVGINLQTDGATRLGVLKYPSSSGPVSASAFFTSGPGANLSVEGSTTYLIVAKYEWVEGATNDQVTLWVNPATMGSTEDSGNRISVVAGLDGGEGAARLIFSRGPNVEVDEVRIGQTWADVTPMPGTPRQLWVTLGVSALCLAAAGVWIAHLRRSVADRSAALNAQIRERQKSEQQRLVEQERARIAHDLHDELGADITEISMLATRAHGDGPDREEGRRCLGQLAEKTHQMVAKLEEIVWAMNPQHDSLGALVDYLSFYADRFLGLANIHFVVESSKDAAGLTLEARVRHQLFLVFKEALANVVKHSGATDVRLSIRVEQAVLRVAVADNGSGLSLPEPDAGGHDGIANMRRRMRKLNGHFEISGEAGRGTTVEFSVPLQS